MHRATSAAIGIGAMVGASVRWGVGQVLVDLGAGFPWSLLLVNAVASVLLGGLVGSGLPADRRLRDGWMVGFCGGLSTMSTLAVELAEGLGAGGPPADVTRSAVLLAGSLLTGAFGYGIARSRTTTAAS